MVSLGSPGDHWDLFSPLPANADPQAYYLHNTVLYSAMKIYPPWLYIYRNSWLFLPLWKYDDIHLTSRPTGYLLAFGMMSVLELYT